MGATLSVRSRLSSWLAAAALCGITLVFYHGLWLPGLVLIKRDAFRFFLPLKQYMIERLAAGELPHWFPYDALGRSFIGAPHTGVFHPFTALYFLLPVHDAYRASTLLSCLLAALGAFALGRALDLSRAGAVIAGVAFALSGYVASLTDIVTYLYSICVLPLFCAGIEKTLRDGRAWAAAPAVIWATVFLHGDLQTGYTYVFIALVWTAMRAPRPRREAFLRLALVGGLTALLAAIQLAPAAAGLLGSDRLDPESSYRGALYWSTHPLRLLTVVAAPIGENADPADVSRYFYGEQKIFLGMEGVWAQSLYVGIPVTGLALIGAWHRRDLRILALLAGFALILSLGRFGILYDLFYRFVPLWSAGRYPEKMMGIVTFAAAMLAGAGMDMLRQGKGRTAPWLAVAILCAAAWLGLRTETASRWTAASLGAPEPLAREMSASAGRALLFSGAAALGIGLVLLGAQHGRLRKVFFLLPLTAIVTLDLARVNSAAYRTGPVEAALFTPPLAQALAAQEGALAPGRFRLVSIPESTRSVPKAVFDLLGPDAEAVERRQALDLEHNAQFQIETIRAYLAGGSKELADMSQQRPGRGAAARFNVRYFVGSMARARDPLFAQGIVAELPEYDLALFKNPVPAKPRAYLSLRPEPMAPPVSPASLLTRSDFQNGEVDVIETREPLGAGPATGGHTRIVRYTPEDVRVRVETPQPAVLILLDAFDAGWRASLENGVEIPIRRANTLARAVVVPAGSHVVTFSYETPFLKTGAWLSLAGVALCLGMIAGVGPFRPRNPGEARPGGAGR